MLKLWTQQHEMLLAAANHSAAVREAGNTRHGRTQQPGLEQEASTCPC